MAFGRAERVAFCQIYGNLRSTIRHLNMKFSPILLRVFSALQIVHL